MAAVRGTARSASAGRIGRSAVSDEASSGMRFPELRMSSRVPVRLARDVLERAGHVCEYCLLPQNAVGGLA
jgi:hypothetical protein